MHTTAHSTPRWTTAADGEAADTSPMELSAMAEHLTCCSGSQGRLSTLRSAAEQAHGFASTRLITTLVVASVLLAAASWLL